MESTGRAEFHAIDVKGSTAFFADEFGTDVWYQAERICSTRAILCCVGGPQEAHWCHHAMKWQTYRDASLALDPLHFRWSVEQPSFLHGTELDLSVGPHNQAQRKGNEI